MFESLKEIDLSIVQYFYLHRVYGADSFLIWTTSNATIIAFSFIILYVLIGWLKKKDKFWLYPLHISFIIGISALVTAGIKLWVQRTRPYKLTNTMTSIVESGGYSFPSGHTTEVFALTTAIFLLSHNKLLQWFSLLWAVFIAYTRMAMGVHFPTDVLGGIVIGSSIAYLWVRFVARRNS